MNVTNRRKSTDADTQPTTQATQQQQHQQQLLAYVSCRQAATASSTNRTRQQEQIHQQYQQQRLLEVAEEDNEDQEQVVTSTSSDCLLPLAAEGEGEEVTLAEEALVTSPARITSSTNNYDILTYNSDSLSLEEMVMPSTSDSSRLERESSTTTTAAALNNPITQPHLSISTRILKSNNDMVARVTNPTTVAEPRDGGVCGSGGQPAAGVSGASTSSNSSLEVNENQKIILKLPKPSSSLNVLASTESQLPNSLIEDDLRKVEPLKINLLNTHLSTHHTPKITIKPILKETPADIQVSSEECSSSAEDEVVSKLNTSELHIVPKLTIRSKNEEHSTVVPKLTIKINDSTNTSTDGLNAQTAANTPPLPKLTIKTGQDGHSESIITNISPASSTTSSSSSSLASFSSSSNSTNSNLPTNSSSSHNIPKLTIKPLQKSHESMEKEQQPSIPKLCIKGNMICGDIGNTDDASSSKIPKLTIKTGQEHAVIITQHNDHANSPGGGIPKLTIKTKSLDSAEDSHNPNISSNTENSSNEKIPKITIKTNSLDSPNIVLAKRSLIKTQLETSPLSPKQAVPKLTITRQQNDMVVTNKQEECGGNASSSSSSIPKMTIKTQQSKTETVPKLTIKNISGGQPRPPLLNEESGMESDVDEEVETVKAAQPCKTVPKLTIKNLGSPKQKLTVVQENTSELNRTAAESKVTTQAVDISNVNLLVASSPGDIDEFADLLTVDNNGESSNSQEFCGFNDNTAESAAKVVVIKNSNLIVEQPDNDSELRRNSDDMDIDVDLQTGHEPQIFQNDKHFNKPTEQMPETLNGSIGHPQITQIIDTVDLTSSPSRSCSPAQFEYNDDSNSVADPMTMATNSLALPNTNILLERLQRETTVIQNTKQLKQQLQQQQQLESNSTIPPPLQPKPNASQTTPPASLKYPQLAERLMANGTSPNSNRNININLNSGLTSQTINAPEENIIDSIEILDTPEGSPRNSLDERPENLAIVPDKAPLNSLTNGLHYPNDTSEILILNNNSNLKRHALATNLAGQKTLANHLGENSSIGDNLIPPSKQRRLNNDAINTKNSQQTVNNNNDLNQQKVLTISLEEMSKTKTKTTTKANAEIVIQPNDFSCLKQTTAATTTATTTTTLTSHQRARKQKHENLLPIAMEEVIEPLQTNSNDSLDMPTDSNSNDQVNENATPFQKRRGRPKKSSANSESNSATPQLNTNAQKEETPMAELSSKSRRVQLLRKRLAIDMVDADEPLRVLDELESSNNMVGGGVGGGDEEQNENHDLESQKRLRTPLRTSRRSNTPTVVQQIESKTTRQRASSTLAVDNNNKRSLLKQNNENSSLNHFLESNSTISSSNSANSTTTLTSTVTSAALDTNHQSTLSMATQIDLTMSSSSSNSNGSTTNTVTTVEASFSKQTTKTQGTCVGNNTGGGGGGGGSSNNSMLPPTTILSSSDPLPDVIFKPNDFSSILVTQQLRAPIMMGSSGAGGPDSLQNDSQDEDLADDVSGPDNSGDDSASSSSTPGRGRGRGRNSRGGRGRGYKAHRLGRNASAVSKAIAMSRPRCVGALKHTPDPDRMKGLYSPSPSVFEEDTRMSADLTQTGIQPEPPQTPTKQPDFLNNEESQSSIISNTSILDPNNVAGLQTGSAVKKPMKRKKMEVCVAEDAEVTVSSIAEYDWPPPKGCCPSKNRDTFMIQEQVALYLGIKSFKRKYPDLPRRQIDMEERNYLQEKSLVSEKMCDLGITAVWASDILDIMYTDFYDKYEEYKDFVRQKHLREIEAKQKSLGLNVAGRGLQARDRAMLSASKWNAYFNRTRKEERLSCLDLQTLTVNKPSPASAPIAAIPNRPVAEAVARAVKAEKIPKPPTLLKERVWEPLRPREAYYPLSLVPGQFCEKFHEYTAQELRQFPLNTLLEPASHVKIQKEETTDTDSAAETVDYADGDKSSNISASERLNEQRRVRRIRAKHTRKVSNEEFKVPPLPGTSAPSSTESSSSSSEGSSSDSDSDSSSCTSSSPEESSEDENSPATCGVCQHPQNRNLKDIPELFLQCYTCRRKVHPSCIEMPNRMANRVRNYNWQCADCKCCIKCKRKLDQNKMLFCEQCDRGFHIYCLSIKAVPDGRWSCDRCSICMRCGATKPEGLPIIQPNGEKLKVKHRKLKWINEYRIDHVTKLREHCSMLCVPCGRAKNVKRVQINTHNNITNTYLTSPGSSCGALSPNNQNTQSSSSATSTTSSSTVNATTTTTAVPQVSPTNSNVGNMIQMTSTANANLLNAAATQISNPNTNATTSLLSPITSSNSSNTAAVINATNKTLESKDSISLTTTVTNSSTNTPQNNTIPTTTITSTATAQNTANSSISNNTTTNLSTLNSTTSSTGTGTLTTTTTTSTATTTTASGGAPPVVA